MKNHLLNAEENLQGGGKKKWSTPSYAKLDISNTNAKGNAGNDFQSDRCTDTTPNACAS